MFLPLMCQFNLQKHPNGLKKWIMALKNECSTPGFILQSFTSSGKKYPGSVVVQTLKCCCPISMVQPDNDALLPPSH